MALKPRINTLNNLEIMAVCTFVQTPDLVRVKRSILDPPHIILIAF